MSLKNEAQYKNGLDMIHLAACALHGKMPQMSVVEKMDLAAVYALAKQHSMTAVTYCGFESCIKACPGGTLPIDEALLAQWAEARKLAVRKNILLDTRREEILSFMESRGIWYMPLKGVLLQELYPRMGMRQMADNDILFDKDHREVICDYMQSRGYRVLRSAIQSHDCYYKEPVYNFEMHMALFRSGYDPVWTEYYENVKERLVKDEDNQYGYHFRDEDFYIYFQAHAYKHYESEGNGIRSLMDTYVYLSKKGECLDWTYIRSEAKRLGIQDFEEMSRTMAMKLFDPQCRCLQEDPDLLTHAALSRYLKAGTYGSLDTWVESKLKKVAGEQKTVTGSHILRYYWYKLFPPMAAYKEYMPFLYRYKILIPFYLPYRWLRGFVISRKRLGKEFALLRRMKKERQ